jgi:hypothetical protein
VEEEYARTMNRIMYEAASAAVVGSIVVSKSLTQQPPALGLGFTASATPPAEEDELEPWARNRTLQVGEMMMQAQLPSPVYSCYTYLLC